MTDLLQILSHLGGIVWGWPMLLLLVGTGVYFTFLLRGLQFKAVFPALIMAFSKEGRRNDGPGSISNFQALMTALCATVGTGNIAGVATAIAVGGPGAVFWMWVTGLLGMATKYSEVLLGVHFRIAQPNHGTMGGPMYYIHYGLKQKWLARLFALLLVIGTFGIGGMVQSNSMADALYTTAHVPPVVTGLVLALFTALVILGGIRRIAQVAATIVPFMIALYVGAGVIILILNFSSIIPIFNLIFDNAFSSIAATGGFAGAALKTVIQQGFSRGVFSNESGVGSAPIVAAAARTKHPAEQALISMTQTFIDTLVVCTFTALIILISGAWAVERGGSDAAGLTTLAFNTLLPWQLGSYPIGGLVVSTCLIFFAFSTILGWSYYGQKGAQYLFNSSKVVLPYKMLFIFLVFLGAAILQAAESAKTGVALAWSFAEISTGLMILPNLIAILLLSPTVRRLTKDYFAAKKNGAAYQEKPFYLE